MRIALVQMCSGGHIARNIDQASAFIHQAAAEGAEYVQTPEVTNLIAENTDALKARIVPENEDTTLAALREVAHSSKIWLHIGSLALRSEDNADKAVNRGFLIAPDGEIAARYDKIHGFRADLPDGQTYDESRNYQLGKNAVIAETPLAKIGLTICYDLRFPHLYRQLAQAGCDLLTVPAAFTVPTGRAHWHVLLRARAIETGCFVLAAAQWGIHTDGKGAGTPRQTYGHSLAIAPWGEILVDGGEGQGVHYADLDLTQIKKARQSVPSLSDDVAFSL